MSGGKGGRVLFQKAAKLGDALAGAGADREDGAGPCQFQQFPGLLIWAGVAASALVMTLATGTGKAADWPWEYRKRSWLASCKNSTRSASTEATTRVDKRERRSVYSPGLSMV